MSDYATKVGSDRAMAKCKLTVARKPLYRAIYQKKQPGEEAGLFWGTTGRRDMYLYICVDRWEVDWPFMYRGLLIDWEQ